MIYSHKPQRSGRSIPTNTNNPPQDPPPPPKIEEKIKDEPIIDIPISDTTPPVVDICPEEIPIKTPKPKPVIKISKPKIISQPKKRFTFIQNIFSRIQKIFKRDN